MNDEAQKITISLEKQREIAYSMLTNKGILGNDYNHQALYDFGTGKKITEEIEASK